MGKLVGFSGDLRRCFLDGEGSPWRADIVREKRRSRMKDERSKSQGSGKEEEEQKIGGAFLS